MKNILSDTDGHEIIYDVYQGQEVKISDMPDGTWFLKDNNTEFVILLYKEKDGSYFNASRGNIQTINSTHKGVPVRVTINVSSFV